MKTQTLLALTAAVALSLSAGCRNPSPRITALPDAAATTASSSELKPNLDTAPIEGAATDIARVPIGIAGSNFPDDGKLPGRDQDRTAFANQTVYFQYDHSNVRTDEASKIDQVAAAFKTKGANYDLLIEGHCAERGTEEYNRSLGERRALALREILVQSGVDGQRIFTRSFGKDQPAVVSHDETAWSKNRRGEFILVLPKKIITTQNTQ